MEDEYRKVQVQSGTSTKSLTVVVESDDTNYKIDATGTHADGKPIHVQYSAKFDGKDYPATGVTNADSVSVNRIDANTIETVQKKNGKVMMTITSKLSKDGKTRTSTWRGTHGMSPAPRGVVPFSLP